MAGKELLVETEETIYYLYQNREHEAIVKMAELLPIYQQMIQVMLVERNDTSAMIYLEMLKKLIENYQARDMLGMADCLSEHAVQMIEYYWRE